MEKTITITTLRRKRGYITKQVKKGNTFLVLRYNVPLFRIVPLQK